MFRTALVLGIVTTSVVMFSGCGNATDPAVLAQRAKFMLDQEPAGALGVIEVRKQLGEDHEGHEHEAVTGSSDQTADQDPTGDERKPQNQQHAEKPEHHEGHEHQGHHHAAEPGETFTVVGRIGGVSNPWSEGIAGFWIVDNSTKSSDALDHEGHDHADHDHADHGGPGHDPETCPFCKQGQDNPKAKAIVQFEDSQGKVLDIDARKLFDVSRNQTVVVRGNTSFDDLGNLVISASGLYIRD